MSALSFFFNTLFYSLYLSGVKHAVSCTTLTLYLLRRNEERTGAMTQLIRLTREGAQDELWSEHFKTILLLLLETLFDNDVWDFSLSKLKYGLALEFVP